MIACAQCRNPVSSYLAALRWGKVKLKTGDRPARNGAGSGRSLFQFGTEPSFCFRSQNTLQSPISAC